MSKALSDAELARMCRRQASITSNGQAREVLTQLAERYEQDVRNRSK